MSAPAPSASAARSASSPPASLGPRPVPAPARFGSIRSRSSSGLSPISAPVRPRSCSDPGPARPLSPFFLSGRGFSRAAPGCVRGSGVSSGRFSSRHFSGGCRTELGGPGCARRAVGRATGRAAKAPVFGHGTEFWHGLSFALSDGARATWGFLAFPTSFAFLLWRKRRESYRLVPERGSVAKNGLSARTEGRAKLQGSANGLRGAPQSGGEGRRGERERPAFGFPVVLSG